MEQSFAHQQPFWKLFGLVLLVCVALWLVALGLLRPRGRRGLLGLLLLECQAILLLGVLLAVDFFHWSHLYPYQAWIPGARNHGTEGIVHPVEQLRQGLAGLLEPFDPTPRRPRARRGSEDNLYVHQDQGELEVPDSSAGISDSLAQTARPRYTVLLLGTSQTRGSGATRAREKMCCRLQERLSQDGLDVRVVNAAQSGTDSTRLLERLKGHLLTLEPDLVVVNLGTNDGDPRRLGANLAEIAALGKARGISTLFVLEANSVTDPEVSPALGNHPTIRAVAREHDVPLLDLHSALGQAELESSGLLWWDFVHLTSYGQELAAGQMAGAVEALLGDR